MPPPLSTITVRRRTITIPSSERRKEYLWRHYPSPDGRWSLAINGRDGVYTWRVDDLARRTRGAERSLPTKRPIGEPLWRPDSQGWVTIRVALADDGAGNPGIVVRTHAFELMHAQPVRSHRFDRVPGSCYWDAAGVRPVQIAPNGRAVALTDYPMRDRMDAPLHRVLLSFDAFAARPNRIESALPVSDDHWLYELRLSRDTCRCLGIFEDGRTHDGVLAAGTRDGHWQFLATLPRNWRPSSVRLEWLPDERFARLTYDEGHITHEAIVHIPGPAAPPAPRTSPTAA